LKTLTIRDEVYQKLASIKREGESFSELFDRLVGDRSSVELLRDIRGSVTFAGPEEREAFVREITGKRGEVRG